MGVKTPGIPGLSLPPTPGQRYAELERQLAEVRAQRDQALRYGDALQYQARQRQPSGAPESGRSKPGVSPWAAVAGAIAAALVGSGGGAVAGAVTQKPAAAPEDIVRVESKIDGRLDRIEGYLRGARDDQEQRDAVLIAVMCAVNGGPPARGVRCPTNACETPPLNPDGKVRPGEPQCRATEPWPTTRRPP